MLLGGAQSTREVYLSDLLEATRSASQVIRQWVAELGSASQHSRLCLTELVLKARPSLRVQVPWWIGDFALVPDEIRLDHGTTPRLV